MASKAIGLLTMVFGADMKGFDKAMKKTDRSLARFSKKLKSAGRTMTQNLTMPILAIGGAAAKLSMDFETAMTKINTLVGISEKEVAKMKEGVLALSGETARSPQELAEALYFLTSAGLRGANAMETLESVAKATTAGLGDMEALARTVAAAQNAYGVETLKASDALDVFGGMVQTGMFKSEELAQVLGQNLGLAANLGIEFDEVGAFIATYTKTTGDANSATTGLSAVMMSFAKITPIQEKALAQINMTAQDVRDSLGAHGLQHTIINLAEKFDAAGVDLSKFFTKSNALKGVLGVLGNQTETYIEILDDLKMKQGFVDSAFDKTSETAGFKLAQAFSSLKAAGIELGDSLAPMIKDIAMSISNLANKYSSLSTSSKNMITDFAKYAALLGPIAIGLGQIASLVRIVIPLITKLGRVALANPIASMFTVAAVAVYKLTSALYENANIAQRAAEESEERQIRVKKRANEATREQIRLINKQFSIAKNVENSDTDRAAAVKFLNKEIRGLNGQLNLENVNTKNVADSIKMHTDALIANAQAAALKDELAAATKAFNKADDAHDTAIQYKMTMFKNMRGGPNYDAGETYEDYYSDMMDYVDYQTKNSKKKRDEAKKEMESIAAQIVSTEHIAAKLTKAKTLAEIEATNYGDSINGLNKRLSDLQIIYNDLEPSSKDYHKTAKMIADTQERLNKKYEKTSTLGSDLTDANKDLNTQLAEKKKNLEALIESGASDEKLAEAAKEVNDKIAQINENLKKYKELVPDNKDEVTGFNALTQNLREAETALQDAIANGEDHTKQLEDYNEALKLVNDSTAKYDELTQGATTRTKGFIDLLYKFIPSIKVFGTELEDIFNKHGESIANVFNGIISVMQQYNKNAEILVNNDKKKRLDALDEEYRRRKDMIDNSNMTEEQRLRQTALLDNELAEEKVKVEQEAQDKLLKIKKRAAIMEKAIAITQIIQSTAQGVMKAWAQGGIFGGPLAALIAGLGAAQVALVASQPIPLADGGIISGPTQALMGEYPSAGAGNPEVVAPLNKLKDMMGNSGGTQRVQIYGRLTGNDIYLSNQSESINRLRTT